MSQGGTEVDGVVRLEGARLSYPSPEGEVEVLKGLDLNVAAGEVVAVTGPSGSGKSSLIAIIGGLEMPTGGSVRVLGTDLAAASEHKRTDLRRRDIGIVFQAYHLVPAMTALQNVALPLMLAAHRDARERAAEILERVGLGHRLSHRPSALSGGEQQRVAVARAFVAGPAPAAGRRTDGKSRPQDRNRGHRDDVLPGPRKCSRHAAGHARRRAGGALRPGHFHRRRPGGELTWRSPPLRPVLPAFLARC